MPRHRPRFVMHKAEADVQHAIRTPWETRDCSSYDGAKAQARRLAEYWAARGRIFAAQPIQRASGAWGLASNAVNGWPPLSARVELVR